MSFYPRVSLAELATLSPHVRLQGELHPADQYQRPQKLQLAGYPSKAAKALQALAGSHVDTPPILHYVVEAPVLVDQGIVLTADGFAVEETLAETRHLSNAQVQVVEDGVVLKQQAQVSDISGLLLKKRGQTNYGHWLCELLVRLYALQRSGAAELPVIVHQPSASHAFLNDMFRESIALLGSPSPQIIAVPDAPVRCRELHLLSGLSSHPTLKHPAGFAQWPAFRYWQTRHATRKHPLLAAMAQQMLRSCGVEHAPHERLLITRRDPGMGRKIRNAGEVEAFFTRQGFQVIDPAEYSLREQIALFSGAAEVFGTMCAAFTNTLFSPPDCRIGYLAPVYMNGAFYLDLDGVLGREDFNLLYCDYVDRPAPWSLNSDITIVLSELEQWYGGLK